MLTQRKAPLKKVFNEGIIRTLSKLADFAVDAKTGALQVANNLSFTVSHRHFSHLLGIVLRDPTITGDTQLLERSVDNWRSLRVRDAHSQVIQIQPITIILRFNI